MIVYKVYDRPVSGIPDYYSLHIKWREQAAKTGDNYAHQESIRLARLAEEFGQAKIEDDETIDH